MLQATDAQAEEAQNRRTILRGLLEKFNIRPRRITRSLGLNVEQLFTFNGLGRYELKDLAVSVLKMTVQHSRAANSHLCFLARADAPVLPPLRHPARSQKPIKDSDERLREKLRATLKPEEFMAVCEPMPKKPRLQ